MKVACSSSETNIKKCIIYIDENMNNKNCSMPIMLVQKKHWTAPAIERIYSSICRCKARVV